MSFENNLDYKSNQRGKKMKTSQKKRFCQVIFI